MSFASRMLIKLLQVSGMKGKLARGSQKTFEEAVSYNRKHPFVMPEDHKAIYEQINIRTGFGVYPCLKISQSDSCRDRAVLFTWGGGGLLNAWKSQLGMPWSPLPSFTRSNLSVSTGENIRTRFSILPLETTRG